MREQDDLYEVLQVSRSASPEVIEAAWRRLARMYHPDVNQSEGAADTMRRINSAYEVLGDPDSRAGYDLEHARRRNGTGTYLSAGPAPGAMLGRRRRRRRTGLSRRRAAMVIGLASIGFAVLFLVGTLIIAALVQSLAL